jgi:flagellar protein FliS
MTYAHAAATYQRNAILTASPEKLIKLLYEGAIRNLEKSKSGLSDARTARSPEVGQSLGRAIGILGELRASLDQAAGGTVAKDLDRLYEYGLDQLSQSNLTRDPVGVNNTLQVLRTLKEGWDGIIAN